LKTMHPLLEVLALAGVFFGWGLARGSVICATICAPAFATRAVDRGYSMRQGVAAAIYFNIPRILILTLLGAVIGYVAFSFSSSVEDNLEPYEEATRWLRVFGYLALGIIVAILGMRMLIRNLDELEDIKEGKQPAACRQCRERRETDLPENSTVNPDASSGSGITGSFRELMRELDPRDRRLFFVSGGMLGLACTSELFVGTLFTGGGLAMLQDSPGAAAAAGGIIMFSFSAGASIPVVAVMAAAAGAARRSRSAAGLNRIKLAGATISVLMGILLVLASLANL